MSDNAKSGMNFLRTLCPYFGLYLSKSKPLNASLHRRIEAVILRFNWILSKCNSRTNTDDDFHRVSLLCNMFVESNCKDEAEFASWYIEKQIIVKFNLNGESLYKDGTNELIHVELKTEDLALRTPKIINKTRFVFVDYCGKQRLGYLDSSTKLSEFYLERFRTLYRGKDIKNYKHVFFPTLGYCFVEKQFINRKDVFILSVDERVNIINILTEQNDDLFAKYVSVFKNNPIETEYHLWCSVNYPDLRSSVNQYFVREILRLGL